MDNPQEQWYAIRDIRRSDENLPIWKFTHELSSEDFDEDVIRIGPKETFIGALLDAYYKVETKIKGWVEHEGYLRWLMHEAEQKGENFDPESEEGYIYAKKKGLKKMIIFNLKQHAKKKDNPFAICTESVGRENKDKYERCVMDIKKKNKITAQTKSKSLKPENNKKGYSIDIEKETLDNNNFRKVLYTAENTQLVLMSLKPKEDIGEEVHHGIDQFFRIEKGTGKVIINGKEHKITDGSSVVVPAGAKHNLINNGKDDLKLYSLYSPPHHAEGTTHKTKEDAEKDDEHFEKKKEKKAFNLKNKR